MDIKEMIRNHAIESFPNECVGFIVNGRYNRLQNISKSPTARYELSLDDKIFLCALGKLEALVHSHPVLDNTPSLTDLKAQASTGFTFWIIGTDGQTTTDIKEIPYARPD